MTRKGRLGSLRAALKNLKLGINEATDGTRKVKTMRVTYWRPPDHEGVVYCHVLVHFDDGSEPQTMAIDVYVDFDGDVVESGPQYSDDVRLNKTCYAERELLAAVKGFGSGRLPLACLACIARHLTALYSSDFQMSDESDPVYVEYLRQLVDPFR
jgi:hypothetical protein